MVGMNKNGQEVLVVHLEFFETDVDINPFCYEKHLKKFVVDFLTMRQQEDFFNFFFVRRF